MLLFKCLTFICLVVLGERLIMMISHKPGRKSGFVSKTADWWLITSSAEEVRGHICVVLCWMFEGGYVSSWSHGPRNNSIMAYWRSNTCTIKENINLTTRALQNDTGQHMKNPAFFDKDSGDVSWWHYGTKHDLDTFVTVCELDGARRTQILFRLRSKDPNYSGSDCLILD